MFCFIIQMDFTIKSNGNQPKAHNEHHETHGEHYDEAGDDVENDMEAVIVSTIIHDHEHRLISVWAHWPDG